MASTVQKQWLIALATIGTIVGAFALAVVLTSPPAQQAAPPAVNDSVAASAIYGVNQQILEIGTYVSTASSNQADLAVASDLTSFANDQMAGIKAWAKDNNVELAQGLHSARFNLEQDRGLVESLKSQRNEGLHVTLRIYLKQLTAAISQVTPADLSETMRDRVADLGARVDSALAKLG